MPSISTLLNNLITVYMNAIYLTLKYDIVYIILYYKYELIIENLSQ